MFGEVSAKVPEPVQDDKVSVEVPVEDFVHVNVAVLVVETVLVVAE